MTRHDRSNGQFSLPREFTPGIWWVGGCLPDGGYFDIPVHFHVAAYVIKGTQKALMFDTSMPPVWPELSRDLDRILDGRPLDYIVPSHPEVAHGGNLTRLLDKYPAAIAVGDMRDSHLYAPDHVDRLQHHPAETTFELGGGYRFSLIEAVIVDLPNTMWGYEEKQQVLFTADALAYGHAGLAPDATSGAVSRADGAVDDDPGPVHRPDECAMMSSEMEPPRLEPALAITQGGLYWSSHVDITSRLELLYELLKQHPARFIAPAHGNVIDDLDVVMPIVRQSHHIALHGA